MKNEKKRFVRQTKCFFDKIRSVVQLTLPKRALYNIGTKNFTEVTRMKNKLMYTIGELLMTEAEETEDVRYMRDNEDVLYVVTKDGKRFRLTIEEA